MRRNKTLSLRQLKAQCRTRAQRRRFNAAGRRLGFRNVRRLPAKVVNGVLWGGSLNDSLDSEDYIALEKFLESYDQNSSKGPSNAADYTQFDPQPNAAGKSNAQNDLTYQLPLTSKDASLLGDIFDTAQNAVSFDGNNGISQNLLQNAGTDSGQIQPDGSQPIGSPVPMIDDDSSDEYETLIIDPSSNDNIAGQTRPELRALQVPLTANIMAVLQQLDNNYRPEILNDGFIHYKPKNIYQHKLLHPGTSIQTGQIIEPQIPDSVDNHVVEYLGNMINAFKTKLATENEDRIKTCKNKNHNTDTNICDNAHKNQLWKTCLMKNKDNPEKWNLAESFLENKIAKNAANRAQRLALDIATRIWRHYVPGQLRCNRCERCGKSVAMNERFCFECYDLSDPVVKEYHDKMLDKGKQTMQSCPFCNTMQNKASITCQKCGYKMRNRKKSTTAATTPAGSPAATLPTDLQSFDV